jgi:predicted nucleotidyltransferase
MESKENIILELFFNYPTKEWHFEEILTETKMARSKVHNWLHRLVDESIIKRFKNEGKMPFYTANHESQSYRSKKKLFALNSLYQSGFIDHLATIDAKAIIIFGSITRSDWYNKSDIDLFIYGNSDGLLISKFEAKLHRKIEIFNPENKAELTKLGEGLIKNILAGDLIKGDLDFVKVKINA